jgi:hypothetical protein
MMLLALVAGLGMMIGVVVFYLAPDRNLKTSDRATHFTIPILSPFTSVVSPKESQYETAKADCR